MANNDNYAEKLFAAVQQKTDWYNTVELPKVLNEYRAIVGYVNNLISILNKRGIIKNDPYKHEKKISDLALIDDSPFADNERAQVIGTRLSDYENMLDYIGNYLKFSVEHMSVEQIKTLIYFNNTFVWQNLYVTSQKPNTKGLAECINVIKMGSDALSTNMANDILNHISKAISKINLSLKGLTEFHRELYKSEVRKNICEKPGFDMTKVAQSTQTALYVIKKMFPSAMGKKPFYAELIEEIVLEDIAPDKDDKRQAVLRKLEIMQTESKVERVSVDTKALLMDAVRSLTGVAPQLEVVAAKIEDNHQILESQHTGFWDKFLKLLRQAFNIDEKPTIYKVEIIEAVTQTKRTEEVQYRQLHTDIIKRIRLYNSFSVKQSSGYQKIESQPTEAIFDFLIKQTSECQRQLNLLTALDLYFKNNALEINRPRIKGLKIELSTIKETLIRTNQLRAEYSAYVDEKTQMQKLGIPNV